MPLFDGVFVENLSGSSVHLVMVITLRGRDVSAIAAAPITGLPLRHLADIEKVYRQAAYSACGITHDLGFGRDQMARRIYDSKKRIGLIAVDNISSEMAKHTLSLNLRVFRETCSFVREAIYIGRCGSQEEDIAEPWTARYRSRTE